MSAEGLRTRIAELADTRWNTLNEYRRLGTAFPEPFGALNRILDVIEEERGALADEITKIMVEELKPWPGLLKPEADGVNSPAENASALKLLDREHRVWEFDAQEGVYHLPPFDICLPLDLLRAQRGPLIELKPGEELKYA